MRVKAPQSINHSSQALGCSPGGLSKSLIENELEGCKLCADDRSRFAGQT